MKINCADYYENYLGDNCDGDCEFCFADKEIVIAIDDFEVSGETILDKFKIQKGDRFFIYSESPKRVILSNGDKAHFLELQKNCFDEHFVYTEEEYFRADERLKVVSAFVKSFKRQTHMENVLIDKIAEELKGGGE